MADILEDIMDATYKPVKGLKEGLIEDILVNLNPFVRPVHFFKAAQLAKKGENLDALVHTVQANSLLPPLPTGFIDAVKESETLKELKEKI